ncbi:hypothetical protein BC828DRAFT_401289 [Blastocladiella britannica]|nr:hypothetical protein BC828DRAFT_401289 [Blastocladiella britannica]
MDSFGNHASLRTTIARLNTPTTTFSTESTPVHSSLPMEGSPIPNIPIRSTPPNSATQSNEVVLPTTVTENNQYPTLVRWWQSRTTLGTLGATVRPGPGNSTAAQQQLSITTVGATAAQGIRIPVRSTVPTTVGVLGNSSSNATNVARNLMHPQFRSKPVCELHCSHCSTPVCTSNPSICV